MKGSKHSWVSAFFQCNICSHTDHHYHTVHSRAKILQETCNVNDNEINHCRNVSIDNLCLLCMVCLLDWCVQFICSPPEGNKQNLPHWNMFRVVQLVWSILKYWYFLSVTCELQLYKCVSHWSLSEEEKKGAARTRHRVVTGTGLYKDFIFTVFRSPDVLHRFRIIYLFMIFIYVF